MNNTQDYLLYKGDILVVDDTPANLRLLVHLLTERGYKVRALPSGKLALAAVKNHPPDLILLDIMMPKSMAMKCVSNSKPTPQLEIFR